MKNFFLLFILFIPVACTDPSSVDADREKIVIDDPSKYPAKFEINPKVLDYGELLINSEKNIQFNIRNLSNDLLTLNNVRLKRNMFVAQLINFTPIILQANGNDSDNENLSLKLNAQKYGYFNDTLLIDNYKNPLIEVKAEIPALFAYDINFEDTKISEFQLKIFNFKNISDSKAVITELELIDSNNVFLNEPKVDLPLVVYPNSVSTDIKLTFNPAKTKNYIAEIRIKASFEGANYPFRKIIKVYGKGIE